MDASYQITADPVTSTIRIVTAEFLQRAMSKPLRTSIMAALDELR